MTHHWFPHSHVLWLLKATYKKCFTHHELRTNTGLEFLFSMIHISSVSQLRKPLTSLDKQRRDPIRAELRVLGSPPLSSPASPAESSAPTSQVLGQSNLTSLHCPSDPPQALPPPLKMLSLVCTNVSLHICNGSLYTAQHRALLFSDLLYFLLL